MPRPRAASCPRPGEEITPPRHWRPICLKNQRIGAARTEWPTVRPAGAASKAAAPPLFGQSEHSAAVPGICAPSIQRPAFDVPTRSQRQKVRRHRFGGRASRDVQNNRIGEYPEARRDKPRPHRVHRAQRGRRPPKHRPGRAQRACLAGEARALRDRDRSRT